MASVIQNPEINKTSTDIAYRRIDSLLRAYGLQHAAIRGLQTQRILSTAIAIQRNTQEPLEAIAAKEVFKEMQSGLSQLSEHLPELGETRSTEKLLLALRQTDIPKTNPQILLGNEAPDAPHLTRLTETYRIQNMPEVKRMSMGAPTLRFESLEEVTEQTSALFDRFPILRKLVPVAMTALFVFLIYTFAK